MIDVKKLKEDLLTTNPTLYCSVKAHLRGKLHMTKLNGGTLYDLWNPRYNNQWVLDIIYKPECVADGRRHMFHWTSENQARLVAETVEKYTIKEEEIAA